MSTINHSYDQVIESHPKKIQNAILFFQKQLTEQDCLFGNQLLPTFLKPVFIDKNENTEIQRVVQHVISILDKVTKLYFTHPELHDYFYIDKKSKELIDIEHGYSKNVVIARPDAFLIDGNLKFVEFNCDSPAGCGLSDVVEETLKTTYPFQELKEQYQFETNYRAQYLLNGLLEAFHEYAGQHREPNIAIVDWKEVRTQGEFRILKKFFKEKGYDTIIADPRDLRLINGRLECNGFPIDLIYRRVIFKEIIERLDEVKDFIEADRQGKVCVVNPLRSRLASNKATLAIMTNQKEFKGFFTEEENKIINHHIPWTRRVLDMEIQYEDNLDFLKTHIINHKNSLVLKPADSYGGKDVTIGCETEPTAWQSLVHRIIAQNEDWVVQKYVEISEMAVPVLEGDSIEMQTKKYNFNPFIFANKYAGAMARLSDQRVINVSAGGGLIPAVVYRENK